MATEADEGAERTDDREHSAEARVAPGRNPAAFSGLAGRGRLDDEAWDELEETLLLADVGMATTEGLLERVRVRARARVRDADELPGVLEAEIVASLDPESDRTLCTAATTGRACGSSSV